MDYDVAALGLSAPPTQAVVTSYRPAVQVRNNGIHNAIASGYLRIYAAGLLIFETEVYSGTLTPGATGTADAVDYWTPPHEGTYVINGYVTTPLDQVEPNNNLNPSTIVVAGGPVPPPPTVPLHAAQHEEGGTDPINVDGLPGVLADRQPAQPHAAQHQAGGDDTLNVSGMPGTLGEPQTPVVHGNAHHNPDMTTADEMTAHQNATAAHTSATNLANRETTGPETGLVKAAQLTNGTEIADTGDDPLKAGIRADRLLGPTNAVHHADKHAIGGLDPVAMPAVLNAAGGLVSLTSASPQTTLIQKAFLAVHSVPGLCILGRSNGSLTIAIGGGQSCTMKLDYVNISGTVNLLTQLIPLAANHLYSLELRFIAGIDPAGNWQSCGTIVLNDIALAVGDEHLVPFQPGLNPAPAINGTIRLSLTPGGWPLGSSASFPCSVIQGSVQL